MITLRLTLPELEHLRHTLSAKLAPSLTALRDKLDEAQREATLQRTCPVCGITFTQLRSGRSAQYCSAACKQKAYRQRRDQARKACPELVEGSLSAILLTLNRLAEKNTHFSQAQQTNMFHSRPVIPLNPASGCGHVDSSNTTTCPHAHSLDGDDSILLFPTNPLRRVHSFAKRLISSYLSTVRHRPNPLCNRTSFR